MTVSGAPAVGEVLVAKRNAADIRYAVLHHSATVSGNVSIFREHHKALGWADVGYHFVICNGQGGKDGEVQEGRPVALMGAHAPGRNGDSVGICLVGDFTKGKPTAAQLQSLDKLLGDLSRQYPIAPERVLGHSEVNPTSCPGCLDVAAVRAGMAAVLEPAPPRVRVGSVEIEGAMIGNRVYVPVRELVNALSFDVAWDENAKVAKINIGGK